MKRIFSSLLATALLGTSAVAADLPSRKSVPLFASSPTQFNWTGGYIGLYFGGLGGSSKDQGFWSLNGVPITAISRPFGAIIPPYSVTNNPVGLLAGFKAGYNFQAQGSPLVFGVEGDVSGIAATGEQTSIPNYNALLGASVSARLVS